MGYSDIEIGNGKYLKIESGETTVIHILSETPVKKLVHRGQNKSYPCEGQNCLHCKDGLEIKTRWLTNVLNRKTKQVQIFEFGAMIAKQIRNISRMLEDEGNNIHQVDLRITASGSGLDKEYTVLTKENIDPVPEGLVLHELK